MGYHQLNGDGTYEMDNFIMIFELTKKKQFLIQTKSAKHQYCKKYTRDYIEENYD